MNVERERVVGEAAFRWVEAPCGDPYCREKFHLYGMVDVGARERWFLAAVLRPDEIDGCELVEDTVLDDPDLFDRATVMAVLWGCRWEAVTPRQIQLQSLTSRTLDPHAQDVIDGMSPGEAEGLRKLCKGGVYPALLEMMGAYAANTGGETRGPIEDGGSDGGEDGGA